MLNKESLKLFLSIKKGEWPLRPDFGLGNYIFEPIDEAQLAELIKQDIEKYFNVNVSVTAERTEYNSIYIKIHYYKSEDDTIVVDTIFKL